MLRVPRGDFLPFSVMIYVEGKAKRRKKCFSQLKRSETRTTSWRWTSRNIFLQISFASEAFSNELNFLLIPSEITGRRNVFLLRLTPFNQRRTKNERENHFKNHAMLELDLVLLLSIPFCVKVVVGEWKALVSNLKVLDERLHDEDGGDLTSERCLWMSSHPLRVLHSPGS